METYFSMACSFDTHIKSVEYLGRAKYSKIANLYRHHLNIHFFNQYLLKQS